MSTDSGGQLGGIAMFGAPAEEDAVPPETLTYAVWLVWFSTVQVRMNAVVVSACAVAPLTVVKLK